MYNILVFDLDGTLLDSTGRYGSSNIFHRGGPKLFKGVVKLLEKLFKEGYVMCIATSTQRASLDLTLEHFGIGYLFNFTVAGDEARSKPDPMMLQILQYKIAKEFPVAHAKKSEKFLMIGDSYTDVDMAHAYGIDCVQVRTGIYTRAWKKAPEGIIKDITELPKWLEKHE